MIRGMRKRRKHNICGEAAVSLDEQSNLRALINSLADGVIHLNKHGIISVYNAAALGILDTNVQISGKHIDDIVKLWTTNGEKFEITKQLTRATTMQKRDDLLLVFDEKNDDELQLEITFTPVRAENGEITGYVLLLRDVTKAKNLDKERDEFISVVSHELRTPVAIAEGALDNARLLMERGFSEKSQEAVAQAHNQVIFLAKMVNDLSTLSRAERGVGDEVEWIDVTELAHQLCREYAPQAEEKGLKLNLDIDAAVSGVVTSRLYLQELLQNFITNSIKYTQQGSITLSFGRHKKDIIFAVTDTGIGIGRSDMKRIFERFYRVEDYRTRETSGTGLGLYVAQKLAKKMNTKIEVRSRVSHGSTFQIALPSAEKPAQ